MTLLLGERPPAPSQASPPDTGPKCPFYGFTRQGVFPFLIDTEGGNACGLVCGRFSPCRMEAAGETPHWDRCPAFNNAEQKPGLDELAREARIFPKSFWPEGQLAWSGMDFRTWFERVMGRPYA